MPDYSEIAAMNNSWGTLEHRGSITLADLIRCRMKIYYLYSGGPTLDRAIRPQFPINLTEAGMKEFQGILYHRLDYVCFKGLKYVGDMRANDVEEWCITPDPSLLKEEQEKIDRFMDLWVFHGYYCGYFSRCKVSEGY